MADIMASGMDVPGETENAREHSRLRLDVSGCRALQATLQRLLELPGGRVVELNLRQVERVTSEDLSTLIHVCLRTRRNGGAVRLTEVLPTVAETLAVTRFEELIDVELADPEAAESSRWRLWSSRRGGK